MIIKKLIKPINNVGVASIQFNGITPISVNNDTHEISIDLSNYYNKSEIDNKLSNVDVDLSEYAKKLDLTQEIVSMTTSQYSTTFLDAMDNNNPKVGFVYQNDNLEILTYPNESYIPTSNDSLVNKSYVDTKQDKLTPQQLAVFNSPIELSASDDLNNCNIPLGKWVIMSRYTKPSNLPPYLLENQYAGYIEYTSYNSANSQGLQRFFPRTANLQTTNNVGYYFQRQFIDNGWTPWYKFIGFVDNTLSFPTLTKISNVDTPINNDDVANKQYVDAQISNINLDNYAKLNDNNIYTQPNFFKLGITLGPSLTDENVIQATDNSSGVPELTTNITTNTSDNSIAIWKNVKSLVDNIDLANYVKLNERNDFSGYNSFTQLAVVGNQNDLGKLTFSPPIPYSEAYMEYNSPNTRANDVCVDLYSGNRNNDIYNYQQSDLAIMRHKDVIDCLTNYAKLNDPNQQIIAERFQVQNGYFWTKPNGNIEFVCNNGMRIWDERTRTLVCLENGQFFFQDYMHSKPIDPFVKQSDISVNLVENVEVAIPNYKVNNKQVYKKYCTNDDQVKATFAIADMLVNMSGMVSKGNGTYRQVPWMYSSGEMYCLDTSVSGLLLNKGNATSGHKLVLEYTKK